MWPREGSNTNKSQSNHKVSRSDLEGCFRKRHLQQGKVNTQLAVPGNPGIFARGRNQMVSSGIKQIQTKQHKQYKSASFPETFLWESIFKKRNKISNPCFLCNGMQTFWSKRLFYMINFTMFDIKCSTQSYFVYKF